MHRQVSAERSKRAEILESEGQRQSAINIAEGQKQSTILQSEAVRSEKINNASGEAEAILLRAKATAEGLKLVAHAIQSEGGQEAVGMGVAEKYVEAFGRLAKEGNAVVVPAGLGDMGGMIAQVRFLIYHADSRPYPYIARSTRLKMRRHNRNTTHLRARKRARIFWRQVRDG
jgi:regulator of protease activity HflC (stomatin/prohibitin superfamily)